MVAPFVGAWIEIVISLSVIASLIVAPFVGAWIEINMVITSYCDLNTSLPLWERGLK